ncbi:MAG: hypothetical protein DWQ49_09390 [Bacteroidetes bacterium]|nr:MAG: hypothetical protein DWQ49_09390 [Bacteroidota bacterium]
MNEKFLRLKEAGKNYNERNDCAVKAVAAACDLTYEQAHNLLRSYGRKSGSGTSFDSIIRPAVASVGFDLLRFYAPSAINTMRKILYGVNHSDTYFVLTTNYRHIVCVKRGEVIDFTEGRRHRIHHIFELVPNGNELTSATRENISRPVNPLNPRKRRTSNIRWKLINKDTGIVYKCYKRKPKDRPWQCMQLRGRPETFGKLRVVPA